MQYVSVRFDKGSRAYTYEWPGAYTILVGDRVIVPPNWNNDEQQFATVEAVSATRLPSGYKGNLAALTGYVDRMTGIVHALEG